MSGARGPDARGMSTALARLAFRVDEALPDLLLFALLRWAVARAGAWPLRVATRVCARACERRAPRLRAAGAAAAAWARAAGRFAAELVFGANAVFVALEAWRGATDPRDCLQLGEPRSLSLAAAVALLCLVCTRRVAVCYASVAVLLCVRERSALSGAVAVVASAVWSRSAARLPLVVGVCCVSSVHASHCFSPAHAFVSASCALLLGCVAATRGARVAARAFLSKGERAGARRGASER